MGDELAALFMACSAGFAGLSWSGWLLAQRILRRNIETSQMITRDLEKFSKLLAEDEERSE